MNKFTKPLLIIAAAAVGIKLLGSKAVRTHHKYMNITAKPVSISKPSFSLRRIKFNLGLELQNNTDQEISISDSFSSFISRVDLYNGNTYLGYAVPAKQEIYMGPWGYTRFRDLEVELPTERIVKYFANGQTNLTDWSVKLHLNIAGKTIII